MLMKDFELQYITDLLATCDIPAALPTHSPLTWTPHGVEI